MSMNTNDLPNTITSSTSINKPIFIRCAGHNVFTLNSATFSSDFDSGNLGKVEESSVNSHEYLIYSAPDNAGTSYEAKPSPYFHFYITNLPIPSHQSILLKFKIMTPGIYQHVLYRQGMKPVIKSIATNFKWIRVKIMKIINTDDEKCIYFEYLVSPNEMLEKVYFAFTNPYSYDMLQQELQIYDDNNSHQSDYYTLHNIYYCRELLVSSPEGRRVDLITISSQDGKSNESECTIPGLFPETTLEQPPQPLQESSSSQQPTQRSCLTFPTKEILFISARVHPGEIPASYTLQGILDFLTNIHDVRAIELRQKYVFKIVPMINPDGVYRGHFRYDQFGNNLNRFYTQPDLILQPSIYAIQQILSIYAKNNLLSFYLDLHAHANKKGCFIYGNVLDSIQTQVQNQLYCKLIAMNSMHFDYSGCLFSRQHMYRVDPSDVNKGLTAEGSGRVSTYLLHNIIHSYTLECNYNSGSKCNELVSLEGKGISSSSLASTATTEKYYTPETFADIGKACMVAWLDLRQHNPIPRLPKTKFRTLDRLRSVIIPEVKFKREFRAQFEATEIRKHEVIRVDGIWRRCTASSSSSSFHSSQSLVSQQQQQQQFGEISDVKSFTTSSRSKPSSALINSNKNSGDAAYPVRHVMSSDSFLDPCNKSSTASSFHMPALINLSLNDSNECNTSDIRSGKKKKSDKHSLCPPIGEYKYRSKSLVPVSLTLQGNKNNTEKTSAPSKLLFPMFI